MRNSIRIRKPTLIGDGGGGDGGGVAYCLEKKYLLNYDSKLQVSQRLLKMIVRLNFNL